MREFYVVEVAHAGRAHGHAVEVIHPAHGQFIVRDYEKRRVRRTVFEQSAKALEIVVVKGGINLIQDNQRRRSTPHGGKQQDEREQGLLSSRERAQGLYPFPWQLRGDLKPGGEGLLRFLGYQLELRRAGTKDMRKKLAEDCVHLFKAGEKAFAGLAVELADRAAQAGKSGGEILTLLAKGCELLLRLGLFFFRQKIDRADLLLAVAQAIDLALESLAHGG